jgi:hypothetical protein
MDAGVATMIFMGLVLKIPVAFACWLVYWAIKSEPDIAEAPEEDGGQRRRFRRSPKRPSGPRRGPHAPGALSLPCPEEGGGLRVARRPVTEPLTARNGAGERR